MKKRHRPKAICLFMIICVSTGFFIAYKIFSLEGISTIKVIPQDATSSPKIISDEALIKSIQQKQELITMEVDLSTNLTVDESWGNLDILKKYQNIHFVGKGIYAVDLSKIKKEDLSINDEKKSINIISPKPFIKAVYIDDKKTEFDSTQNGILRFGDIKLSPSEFDILQSTAKNSMNEKIQNDETFNDALIRTKESISSLINSILGEEGKQYNISIQFQ